MIIASATQFHVYLPSVNALSLNKCLKCESTSRVILVGAFNQEKVLVGTFSVIVKSDGSTAALILI